MVCRRHNTACERRRVSFIAACVSFGGPRGKETARLGEPKALPDNLTMFRLGSEL